MSPLAIAFGLDEQLLADERIRTANYQLDSKPERLAETTSPAGRW